MTKQVINYTSNQKFEALAYFFGWQGGTIHQLEQETGCSDIFNRALDLDKLNGFSAVRTCSKEFRVSVLAKQYIGDWNFWSGVIRGYWVTGALGGKEFSVRFGNT